MKTHIYQFFILCMVGLFISYPGYAQTGNLRAVGDTVNLVPGIPVTIDLTANDVIPLGDSIWLTGGSPDSASAGIRIQRIGTRFTYTATPGHNGIFWGHYLLRDITVGIFDTSSAPILFRIRDHSYDSLCLNNINARFNANGIHFFDSYGPKFEVPKFSGKSTIFVNTLWIGGLDDDSLLHLAAARYGQGPSTSSANTKFDFWVGPVMDSSAYSIYQDTTWNYIWNLKKSDIEYHKSHWQLPGYQPIHDILTWPGNGNVAMGQAQQLAPFFDRNQDGIYNPFDGDYPLIKGDQSLFFIFNDDRGIHEETMGNKLKVEIHGMAYAFDIPSDSAFWNTIFLSYKIYNRSQKTYHSSYIGSFTDLDIGYPNDDYIGCDVQGGFYFGYNGKPIDGNGQPGSYGANPPAQSVTILAGPYMDPDGLDNPRTDINGKQLCNESVNGTNFGDGIVDNERYGMRKFLYFNNNLSGVPLYMQDPNYAPEYYNLMKGLWRDSTRLIYGGNGNASAGGYGPACDFMFPGVSDSLNWGVGCQPPNGPENWTEETALNNPSDKRGMASMGPFTFHPGDAQEVDLAFTFARDYTGKTALSSLDKLRTLVDITRNSFKTNTLPNGQSFNGISGHKNESAHSINLYPNPANSTVTLELKQANREPVHFQLISIDGTVVQSGVVNQGVTRQVINVEALSSGVYMMIVRGTDLFETEKLVISR